MYRVESRLVEVPVLLTSVSGKEQPELSEKDLRIYEDDSLRATAFFGKEAEIRDMDRIRHAALAKARAGGSTAEVRQADAQPVTLGRLYLVFDNMMTDAGAFQQAQRAAEKIIREYQHALRPITLRFTSQGSAMLNSNESVEQVLERARKATPLANSSLTSNDEIMTIHEAYLIDRGDQVARELAELRCAAGLQVTFSNNLGSVTGQMDMNPDVVRRE